MRGNAMFAPLAPEEARAGPTPKPGSKTPIVPVPADAPPIAFRHPKRGEPSSAWPYHDAAGCLTGYVCRWDFLDAEGKPDKEFLPVTYCELGGGKRGWRSKGIPAPRPLYDLPAILADPGKWVLVCEGENSRDAARDLFPGMVATTPAHGAKSPRLTDFGPCAGRTVVVWRDYDEPGRAFGDAVYELARAAGAAQVLDLDMTALGERVIRDGAVVPRGTPMKEGYDAADAVGDGWTAELVASFRPLNRLTKPYRSEAAWKANGAAAAAAFGARATPSDAPKSDGRIWPFRLAPNGVEKRVERTDRDTGLQTVEWRWFCSSLEVAAETRSSGGDEWGRLLSITDRDGRVKQWAMPMSMLAGDGTAYRERLLSLGLVMSPGKFARDALHEFISTARPETKARCVSRIGWQGKVYVGFTRNYGERPHG